MKTRRKKPVHLTLNAGQTIMAYVQTTPPSSPPERSPLLKPNENTKQSTSSIFKAGLGGTLMCLSGGSFYFSDTAAAAATTVSVSTELSIAAYTFGGFGLLLLIAYLYNNRASIYGKLFSAPHSSASSIRRNYMAKLGVIASPVTPRYGSV